MERSSQWNMETNWITRMQLHNKPPLIPFEVRAMFYINTASHTTNIYFCGKDFLFHSKSIQGINLTLRMPINEMTF